MAQLTQQEQKILALVAEGKTERGDRVRRLPVRQDGEELRVSSILSKLNLERRAQAAAFVARHRIPGSGS